MPQSLFERHGKRKHLSPYGREVYKGLSTHLRSIDDVLRKSKFGNAKESDVTIRLGVNNEIYYRICNKLSFSGNLEVYNQRSAAALSALLKRELDMAVCRVVPDSNDIIAVKWYSDTFVIAYPKVWINEIEKSDLKTVLLKRRFILNLESKSAVEESLLAMDLLPGNVRYGNKLTDWLAVLKLVREGHGWSIVPSSFEFTDKIETAPIGSKSIPKTQFYILYHKSVRNFAGFQPLLASMLTSLK